MITLTKRLALTLGAICVLAGAIPAVVVSGVRAKSSINAAQADTDTSRIASCERSKADRIDTARASTAQAKYLRRIIAARSVAGDVRSAAVSSERLWEASAVGLRSRLLLCEPLITSGSPEIDTVALEKANTP